jgi:hypothetical protein
MMRVSEGLPPLLHNILLVILGLVLIALLTAIFEALGLKKPSLHRADSGGCVYRRCGIWSLEIPRLVGGIACNWDSLWSPTDNEGVPMAEKISMRNSLTAFP